MLKSYILFMYLFSSHRNEQANRTQFWLVFSLFRPTLFFLFTVQY